MEPFDHALLGGLVLPTDTSRKGQNGKLLIIAGSHLFHAAAIWPLTVASRIVDMVFFSSVPLNNQIVEKAKEEFKNGIAVPRENLDEYIREADAVLIGPGMVRDETIKDRLGQVSVDNLAFISSIQNEGEQTYLLTRYVLTKYPEKRFIIDAGALQMLDPTWLIRLKEMPILTPHQKEFLQTFNIEVPTGNEKLKVDIIKGVAEKYHCVILLKGKIDVVCSPSEAMIIEGGNAGMTKGGTGDVLSGLVASFYTKSDAFISAACASHINKKAGERLYSRMGYFFNASDLANELPAVMNELFVKKTA